MAATYIKLEPLHDEFRLLRLHGQSSESQSRTLTADLETFRLAAAAPRYVALSYEWAASCDDDAKIQLSIAAKEVDIGENLARALWTFSSVHSESLWIWVDTVCINQRDLDERATQVRIMGKIYARASEVWVWLGGPIEKVHSGIRQLEKLAQPTGSQPRETPVIDRSDVVSWFEEIPRPNIADIERYLALSGPWWGI
jgi:hypothetical protein